MEHPQLGDNDAPLGRMLASANLEEPWFKSIGRGLRETFNPPKLPPLELTSRPIEGVLDGIGVVELPWYKSLIANVKELVHPPKLAPLEVTSKPVEVGTIWGAYGGGESKSGAVSILVHIGVVGLMLLIFQSPQVQNKIKEVSTIIYAPPLQQYKPKLPPAAQKAGGGGGGGNKAPTPVSKGAPPKFAPKQFIAPTLVNTPKPVLPVAPTITAVAPPLIADNYGDPLSKNLALSAGQGEHGLGSGKGSGLGNGNGNGYGNGSGGGCCGGAFHIGGEVSAPQIISKIEPEYSEEARKAKYSGSVLLTIVVDERGLPRDIKVVRPLGLGLDEKAIEAVSHWRFLPGKKGGAAVSTIAQVEVNFRLL